MNIFVTFRCAFLEVLPNIQDVVSPTVWCFTFQLCWRSIKIVCTIIHMGMSQKWAPTIPMVIIMFPIKWQFLGVRNFEANPTSYCSFYLYSVISPFSLGKSCLKYPKIDIPRYEPYYEIYHQFTIIYHNVPEFTIVYHNLPSTTSSFTIIYVPLICFIAPRPSIVYIIFLGTLDIRHLFSMILHLSIIYLP